LLWCIIVVENLNCCKSQNVIILYPGQCPLEFQQEAFRLLLLNVSININLHHKCENSALVCLSRMSRYRVRGHDFVARVAGLVFRGK